MRVAALVLLPLCGATLVACSAKSERASARPPGPGNILILVADDLGVDGVTAYGEGTDPPPTPNLSALAARGVLFRNAWASPVCSPTRAAIMTGRYSFRTGIGAARGPRSERLSPQETILPEAFDAARSPYAHAMIGKWHLSDGPGSPRRAGWGYVVEGPQGFPASYYRWPRTVNRQRAISTTYLTSQLVDDALEWIGRQRRPWLCYLAFYAPHGPWMEPPAELHSRDLSGIEPRRYSPAYFEAMVEALDTEIGRLFEGIGDDLERTHVIFIGDNGAPGVVTKPPFVPEHGKGTPFEGGVNVPLIIAGPAVESPGREVGALVSAVDLFSTVLELAGVDPAIALDPGVPIDSISLVPYLRDPSQEPLRDTVYAERFENWQWRQMDHFGFATVRGPRYKLIRFYDDPRDELYDLEADPWEERNLLARTSRSGAGAELTELEHHAYEALSTEIVRLRSAATFGSELPDGRTALRSD